MYIDYGTKIIHVLQSDLTSVSGTLYELLLVLHMHALLKL